MQQKIPPFGKSLFALQQKHLKPISSVYLWIGDKAWQKGKAFSPSRPVTNLILPPWECPTTYLWPVKDCDVLILETSFADLEYVEDLVYCLYSAGAEIVRLIKVNDQLIVYHKE